MVLFTLVCFSYQKAVNAEDANTDALSEMADIDNFPGEKKSFFKFSGQWKDLFTWQKTDSYRGTNPFTTEKKGLAANLKRLRLSPEISYGRRLFFHLDYDNELILSSFNKSIEFDSYWRPSEFNDFLNISWEPGYSRDLLYRTKIHRAYFRVTFGDLALTIGRQQIRFGSGRLWNPLDILNPVSPTFVEGAEEQKGTDALRVDYYVSSSTEISVILNPLLTNNRFGDFSMKNCNYVTRLKTEFGKTDAAILGGWISRRGIAGADSSTVFFDGMLRGSLIYSHPEDDEFFIQSSIGYEYTFANGLYLLVEYFYNQNSINQNNTLKNALAQSLLLGMNSSNFYLLSNQFITYNSHYTGVALGYDIFSLLREEFFVICDFEGRGFFINESLKYNIFENVDLVGGVMLAHVFSGSRHESDFNVFDDGEFLYYFSMNLYF